MYVKTQPQNEVLIHKDGVKVTPVQTDRDIKNRARALHPLVCVAYYWRPFCSMRPILYVSQFLCDGRDALSLPSGPPRLDGFVLRASDNPQEGGTE